MSTTEGGSADIGAGRRRSGSSCLAPDAAEADDEECHDCTSERRR
ncbi:hypothetical protein [Kitasatospora sp. NPDC056531]